MMLLLLLAVSCGPRRISRDNMEEIMYQVLLQDQQIKYDHKLRLQADTCLVYEAIFEEYGYDTDDFLYSLEYYLAEPAKFEKIMERVGDRLDKEVSVVRAEVRQMQWRERLRRMEQNQQSVEDKIEEIRLVNRAKWLLIECLHMTEADAQRYIEKQSMDQRITKRRAAENIIKTYS